MHDDYSQLAKNFAYRFRYALLVLGVGTLALALAGVSWAFKKSQHAARERQHQEIARTAESERARQIAVEQKRQDEQRAIAQQERAKEMERKRKADEAQSRVDAENARELAERQRREYIARYVRNTTSLKTPEHTSIAIGLADSNRILDESFAGKLSTLFNPARVKASGMVFAPASVTDGVLQKIRQSDKNEISKLGLASLVDAVLIGDYRTQFSTNSELQNIVTAHLHFACGVIKTESGSGLENISFDVSGAGFSNDQAESAAKEYLLKKLKAHKWIFVQQ